MSASLNAVNPQAGDTDSQETREWRDALAAVVQEEGLERAHFILEQLIDDARQAGIDVPIVPGLKPITKRYQLNSIPRKTPKG